eukprot:TRINITY_DN32804_c0_g1_i1.p5 TRINITY_DN32804_c0_g1~~TRINITY_DN32804_c0_g1_i1.p5  ORF type:complete len:101 (-),score=10.17 TRINITY_DN32804_c0_g1_i1:142-444(-)
MWGGVRLAAAAGELLFCAMRAMGKNGGVRDGVPPSRGGGVGGQYQRLVLYQHGFVLATMLQKWENAESPKFFGAATVCVVRGWWGGGVRGGREAKCKQIE